MLLYFCLQIVLYNQKVKMSNIIFDFLTFWTKIFSSLQIKLNIAILNIDKQYKFSEYFIHKKSYSTQKPQELPTLTAFLHFIYILRQMPERIYLLP